MKSTRKANPWPLGRKAPGPPGLGTPGAVTAANGPEGTLMEPGLPGPEQESYGDQGSACPKCPAKAEAPGTTWRVLRKQAAGES